MKKLSLLCACCLLLACSSRSGNADSGIKADVESPLPIATEAAAGSVANQESMPPATEERQLDASTMAATTAALTPNNVGAENKPATQLIKTIEYYFQVEDVDKTAAALQLVTTQNKGYVSTSNFTTDSGVKQYEMALRIPSSYLSNVERAIDEQSLYLNHKIVNTNDVTAEYIDVQTRLKTKKEVLDRYIAVLRNQAKTVKDVLAAEEQIRVLQEEIDVQEGRLRYLQNQVSYSTIHLRFYQESTIKSDPNVIKRSFLSDLITAFVNGWQGILGLIVGLVAIWPVLLISTILFIVIRRLYRRWKNGI